MYLEYHKKTKQVVEIHENEPIVSDDYDYAMTAQYKVGDEFEWTIWVNEADEEKNLTCYSAVRNNPNAKRLLEENKELKIQNQVLEQSIAELEEVIDILLGGEDNE